LVAEKLALVAPKRKGRKYMDRRRAAGFSLLELMIVIGIIMVVAAMAMPKLMTTIADVRLRGAINSASGIIQQARMLSIKDNLMQKVSYSNTTGGGFVYVKKTSDTSALNSMDPQVQMGSAVVAYNTPTGIPALAATDLSYTPVVVTSVMFNSRGLPCSSTTVCGSGMVIYFTDSRRVGSPGWGAVSVSPAGRVKTWMWSGGRWGD
jgi:Tfp pilus assembly protein FimT